MDAYDTGLPWQQEQWQRLQAAHRAGRLPHALLLTGPRGMGKARFARRLAQSLLCESPAADAEPCKGCTSCRLFRAETHPDWLEVGPADEGKVIKVDQVRELTAFLALKSRGHKLVLVVPAQAMNLHAANSLLKTLEEPPPRSLLLLVATRAAMLPVTVRSRCQTVVFRAAHSPATVAWLARQLHGQVEEAERLLALCTGAPFAALDWAQRGWVARREALFSDFGRLCEGRADPVASAAAWLELGVAEALRWMIGWLGDMVRLRLAPGVQRLDNPDLRARLQALAGTRSLRQMFAQLDRLQQGLKLADGPSNINAQMLLESLLVAWAHPGDA